MYVPGFHAEEEFEGGDRAHAYYKYAYLALMQM